MKVLLLMATVATLALAVNPVRALEGDAGKAIVDMNFNDKITAWVEGNVLAVDTAAGKFTVRGSKRLYATEYARMMTDIHNKTRNLNSADRDAKEAEIRKSYNDSLAKAQTKKGDKDSDFTFYLPSKDSLIAVFDENSFYGNQYGNQTFQDRKQPANMSLADFKTGDHVLVGYEAGVLTNHVYAVVHTQGVNAAVGDRAGAAETPRNASFDRTTQVVPVAPDNTKVNVRDRNANEVTADSQHQNSADIEITKNIRQAIVKDDTLSTYAHNIKIITQNGAVTLKGPVKSASEKSAIEAKAQAVAGEHVTSQIEVAP